MAVFAVGPIKPLMMKILKNGTRMGTQDLKKNLEIFGLAERTFFDFHTSLNFFFEKSS